MSVRYEPDGGGGNSALAVGQPLRAQLHALTLESPDPRQLAAFYTRTMGFFFYEQQDRWVGSARDRRLTFTGGAARKLVEACFLVDTSSDLDFLERRVQGAGTLYSRVRRGTFVDALSFADPDGNRLVFAHGAALDAPRLSGPLAQRTARLQHIVLGSSDAKRLIRFYDEVVGFRTSDTVLDDAGVVRTAFLNCGSDHHSVAVFATTENRLDHFCFETGDWGLIRDWSDHFSAERIPLKWGPGRHGPGNNLFVFIHDLDGNWVELSAELEQITPERPPGTWRHEERTLNSWGEGRLRS